MLRSFRGTTRKVSRVVYSWPFSEDETCASLTPLDISGVASGIKESTDTISAVDDGDGAKTAPLNANENVSESGSVVDATSVCQADEPKWLEECEKLLFATSVQPISEDRHSAADASSDGHCACGPSKATVKRREQRKKGKQLREAALSVRLTPAQSSLLNGAPVSLIFPLTSFAQVQEKAAHAQPRIPENSATVVQYRYHHYHQQAIMHGHQKQCAPQQSYGQHPHAAMMHPHCVAPLGPPQQAHPIQTAWFPGNHGYGMQYAVPQPMHMVAPPPCYTYPTI